MLAVVGAAVLLGVLLLYILAEHALPHTDWRDWHFMLAAIITNYVTYAQHP